MREDYLVIEKWMVDDLKLKGTDLFVYAIIYGVTKDGESIFMGSLQYADWCGVTKQGIQKNLKHLLEFGYIKKNELYINNVKRVSYQVTLTQTSCKLEEPEIDNPDTVQAVQSNQQVLFGDALLQSRESIMAEQQARVDLFIAKYNEICVSLPKCLKLNPQRKKAILALTTKYSDDEILTAFTKLEASDFCTGHSGRGWKADIDFIYLNKFYE